MVSCFVQTNDYDNNFSLLPRSWMGSIYFKGRGAGWTWINTKPGLRPVEGD